jgi:PAS domain S-box-containing protein
MSEISVDGSQEQSFDRRLLEHELILQAAGEGIYGFDAAGHASFVNQSAIDMLGWELKDFQGNKNTHECHHHSRADGSHYPKEECPIYASLRDGKVHREDNEVFFTKDNKAIPVEYISRPIIRNDEIVGAVVVFTDITERKKAALELQQAFVEIQKLKDALEKERDYLKEEFEGTLNYGEIVGESSALQRMLVQIEAVAPTPANVLIYGESGTGKELTARAIHNKSDRSQKPLIKVNCGSIPKELFESEFFGHVKGSFTGAHRDRIGRFELADGGTLFLDEIGEIPLDQQSKLLRALQEKEFERIGDEKTKKVDVRIIAATNRDLKAEVAAGRFREDLFYRLSVFPLEVPPLRERREDIVPLALHFLKATCTDMGKCESKLTREQGKLLENYQWPGNIRELQHVIARAAILSTGKKLQLDPTQFQLVAVKKTYNTKAVDDLPKSEFLTINEFKQREKENIIAALQYCKWRVSGEGGAADLLEMKPTTLAHQMKKFQIKKPI